MSNTKHRQGWHSISKRKWLSRKTHVTEGSMHELLQKVPRFKKVPCAIDGEGVNPHLDMIVRDRIQSADSVLLPHTDHVQMPVSTVSHKYELVQHQELLNALACVVKEHGFDLNRLHSELCLTEFGERMWFSFTLPSSIFNSPSNKSFDPGDKYSLNLTVNALNSVDKTAALEINLYWYRIICGNGMVFGDNIRFKEIHRTETLDRAAIRTFLQDQLALSHIEKEKELLIRWYETKVYIRRLSESKPNRGQIEQWLNKHVSETWSVHAAARVYHIAKTGLDGNFTNKTKKKKNVKYSDLTLDPKTITEVPGAFAPVRNAYDLSQVLSWIASRQNTLQKQLVWMTDIPKLMQSLLTTDTITLTVDE